MNEALLIIVTAFLSLSVLFIIAKAIGQRTITNMSMYDYVNSIAIGSIAAQLATASDEKILHNVIAMVIYGVFTYCCAIATDKNKKLRNFFEGHPIVLIEKGKVYKKNFKKAHLDMEELQANLRPMGYFDMSKVDTVILETNGKVSVIPIASEKPVTAMDLSLHPEQEELLANVILDGNIMQDNLHRMGKDETWLKKEISRYKIKDQKEIFLATLDSKDTVNFYVKVEPPEKSIL